MRKPSRRSALMAAIESARLAGAIARIGLQQRPKPPENATLHRRRKPTY